MTDQEYCPHCNTVGRYVTDGHGTYFKPTVNVAYAAELEMRIADLVRQREELAEVLRWYGANENWLPLAAVVGTFWWVQAGDEASRRAKFVLKSVLGEGT